MFILGHDLRNQFNSQWITRGLTTCFLGVVSMFVRGCAHETAYHDHWTFNKTTTISFEGCVSFTDQLCKKLKYLKSKLKDTHKCAVYEYDHILTYSFVNNRKTSSTITIMLFYKLTNTKHWSNHTIIIIYLYYFSYDFIFV